MNNSKVITGILCLSLASSLFGLAVAGWRTIDYAIRMHLPLHALWFGVKAICFAGISIIGISLFTLLRKYSRQGYFDDKSTLFVQFIGLVTVVVAVSNSLFHVLTYQVISVHATALPPLKNILGSLVTDLFYESPVLFFFSILVFLFASFMGKAIEVKREVETFV